MKPTLRSLGLLALLGVLLLGIAGCSRVENSYTAEESEPNFERGRSLVKQGRTPEALACFLKVIAKRGDDAPESHLEAALIYRQHLKDQLAAIYHFKKFIELEPNSRQADLVRNQIQASIREFARTLPAHPLEDQSIKLNFQDQLDRLQRENDQLKAEITALRAGIPVNAGPARSYSQGGFDLPVSASRQPPSDVVQPIPVASSDDGTQENSEGNAADPDSPFARPATAANYSTPQPDDVPFITKPSFPPPNPTTAQGATGTTAATTSPSTGKPSTLTKPNAPTTKPTAPSASGRRHSVGPGDTLSSISQKYYGTRARAKDIQAANRDLLKGGDKLSIGMELKLP